MARKVHNKQSNKTLCSFRLQNFAKCLCAVKIASPRDGLRKGKGCKMLVIRRDSTKTKSKANPTLLRTATKDSVLNFSWRAIGQEILEKSPLFYRLLLALADPKSLSKSSDPERTERYLVFVLQPLSCSKTATKAWAWFIMSSAPFSRSEGLENG